MENETTTLCEVCEENYAQPELDAGDICEICLDETREAVASAYWDPNVSRHDFVQTENGYRHWADR